MCTFSSTRRRDWLPVFFRFRWNLGMANGSSSGPYRWPRTRSLLPIPLPAPRCNAPSGRDLNEDSVAEVVVGRPPPVPRRQNAASPSLGGPHPGNQVDEMAVWIDAPCRQFSTTVKKVRQPRPFGRLPNAPVLLPALERPNRFFPTAIVDSSPLLSGNPLQLGTALRHQSNASPS